MTLFAWVGHDHSPGSDRDVQIDREIWKERERETDIERERDRQRDSVREREREKVDCMWHLFICHIMSTSLPPTHTLLRDRFHFSLANFIERTKRNRAQKTQVPHSIPPSGANTQIRYTRHSGQVQLSSSDIKPQKMEN